MGLTTWKGEIVLKTDVVTAKNFLSKEEVGELNRIVVMWLDFAEDQARRRQQVFLRDWRMKLDEFLRFNERGILNGAGTISKKEAEEHAKEQYEVFARRRREFLEAEGARDGSRTLEDLAAEDAD